MKTAALLAALVACAAAQSIVPLLAEKSPTRVPGEYVVVFEEGTSDADVFSHVKAVRNMMSYHGNDTNFVQGEYHIGSFRGYGARMDDKLRDTVRSMKSVKYVECSQYYYAVQGCTNQVGATWGIVRTTYRNKPTVKDYSYDPSTSGGGVDVYIIDTGIYTIHPDFGGRAVWGEDFVDSPSPRTDLNGHGTHVAGTVMSNTWGLAKKATAIAVRVLDQNGSGSTTGVINGINYVADEQKKSPGKKSIANMSLGGGLSTALNSAVDAAVDTGVHFAVAAGNEAQDACNVSPASAKKCVTVGASDESDEFAFFSNYGTCEDIIAPGVDITSTWLNGQTNTISGTSMAAPHVAGVMAKYLTTEDLDPDAMKTKLNLEATDDKIQGVPTNTPNKLVFKECVG